MSYYSIKNGSFYGSCLNCQQKKMEKYKKIKNKYGYFEVSPKPSEEELTEFYENQYFQKKDY